MEQAREFGYQGNRQTEAKKCLKAVFNEVEKLVESHFIPSNYVVFRNNIVDREATLRNIKQFIFKQTEAWKRNLDLALLKSIQKGNKAATRLFLWLGANPNCIGKNGNTALTQGQGQLVPLLLHFGADPNLCNIDGKSPLMIYLHNPAVIRLLFEKGADGTLKDKKGFTAIMHFMATSKKASFETYQLLYQYHANIVSNKEKILLLNSLLKSGYTFNIEKIKF